MKKLVFRADGDAETGLGHLYRVFALIEIYKEQFESILLTKATSTKSVIPFSYVVRDVPEGVSLSEEPAWIAKYFTAENNIVVLDGYGFGADYQKALKNLGFTVVYIDDFATEHMYADVVVNHANSVVQSGYHAEPYTRLALGTRYAILRPAFLRFAGKTKKETAVDTALVCFGGADLNNLTYKAASALLSFPTLKRINIVTGAAYKHKDIHTLAANDKRIRIFNNLNENDLARLMDENNLAVTSASTVLYEICAVKMPVIAGFYTENQVRLYNGCLEHGLIYGAGNIAHFLKEDFESKIKPVLEMQGHSKQIEAQQKHFDGHIRERFLSLLKEIKFRSAVSSDMMQIFVWANDRTARENSYFSEPISLDAHKSWFERKLGEKNSRLYIAEIDNTAAGMVRYDTVEEHTVVGVTVDAAFRGQGLAAELLRKTAKMYFQENSLPIWAYIKKVNLPSKAAFEKAGYKWLRDETVQGVDSYVYELKISTKGK